MKQTAPVLRSIFLILLTGILISSCKKDSKSAQNDLIGTWKTGTSTFDATVGGKTMNQYFIDAMGLSAADAQLYTNLFNLTLQQNFTGTITFKSDKTYTSNLGGQNDTGTWDLSSAGDKLTINSSTGQPLTLDVVALNANTLHVKWIENGSYDVNGDNVPESITVNVDMTFTK
jgi:hypothetical protein